MQYSPEEVCKVHVCKLRVFTCGGGWRTEAIKSHEVKEQVNKQ